MGIQTDKRPNLLLVSKDWGSTVLWGYVEGGHMANYSTYERFGFPDSLIRRCDFWSGWYEHNDPLQIEKTLDWSLWEAYGLALAIDIKRILRDRYAVYYGTEREIPFLPFDIDWIPPRDDLDKESYSYDAFSEPDRNA